MEKTKVIIAMLSFLTILLTTTIPVLGQTATPNVSVSPRTYSASAAGEIFTVDIHVTDGVAVAGYGIKMGFDPGILVVSGWQSGGFLETSGVSTLGLTPSNHSEIGWVGLGDVLAEQGSANGNGTLVKINFTILGGGRCGLNLYNTTLYDENNDEIVHTETDGQFIYSYISLTPETGTAAFMIQGFGFEPDTLIASVTWNGTIMPTMTTRCDARGNFVTPAIAPDISIPGNYTISAIDSSGNHKEAIFNLTVATGTLGPTGPAGPQGDTGPQGPAGTGGANEYTWASLVLSIIAILIGIYVVAKKKN